MAEDAIISLRPDRFVFDAGSTHWRGGQVWAIDGAVTTIRVMTEQHAVANLTCLTALVPVGARVIGAAVCCRLDGDAEPVYTIGEVIESSFHSGTGPINQQAEVAANRFHPGIVPRSRTGEPREWWRA